MGVGGFLSRTETRVKKSACVCVCGRGKEGGERERVARALN